MEDYRRVRRRPEQQTLAVMGALPASLDLSSPQARLSANRRLWYQDIGGLDLARSRGGRCPPRRGPLQGRRRPAETRIADRFAGDLEDHDCEGRCAPHQRNLRPPLVGDELVQKYIGEGLASFESSSSSHGDKAPTIIFIYCKVDSIGAKRLEVVTEWGP